VVLLPHEAPEPRLLRAFSRMAPAEGTAYPSVLYLTHRAGLLPSFHIRPATAEDLPACRGLASELPKRKAVYGALVAALEHETALVAVCEGQVTQPSLPPHVKRKHVPAR
jgi:hypothetical protein